MQLKGYRNRQRGRLFGLPSLIPARERAVARSRFSGGLTAINTPNPPVSYLTHLGMFGFGDTNLAIDGISLTYIFFLDGSAYTFPGYALRRTGRIQLPTGGKIEYGWKNDFDDPSLPAENTCGSTLSSGSYVAHTRTVGGPYATLIAVTRRLCERREYADGSTLFLKTTYTANYGTGFTSCSVTTPITATASWVRVEDWDYTQSPAVKLSGQTHYFYGEPYYNAFPDPVQYPVWHETREFKTEYLDASNTVLRTNVNYWQQRLTPSLVEPKLWP